MLARRSLILCTPFTTCYSNCIKLKYDQSHIFLVQQDPPVVPKRAVKRSGKQSGKRAKSLSSGVKVIELRNVSFDEDEVVGYRV